MYYRIKLLVMSTFKEIKDKLKFTQNDHPQNIPPSPKVEKKTTDQIFEIEEARYMLNLVANSDFKGRDIQVVYDIAFKLQNILQTIND